VIVEPTPRIDQNSLEIIDYEARASSVLNLQQPRLAVNNRNLSDYYRSQDNSPIDDFPKSTLTPSIEMSAFKSREKLSAKMINTNP
jgi:hypothetical protein